MNISPISFSSMQKQPSFKGKISEAIDRNTEALNNLAKQVELNTSTIYGIEKVKSSDYESYQYRCYAKTNSPEQFVEYVGENWDKFKSF